jgi:hypothetical protein
MSDTEEWERSVQQVLLPSEDSDNRTLVEMPPKKKLTVSHINKKLEDYHGEMRSEQQTLVEWVLQREKQEQEKEGAPGAELLRRDMKRKWDDGKKNSESKWRNGRREKNGYEGNSEKVRSVYEENGLKLRERKETAKASSEG